MSDINRCKNKYSIIHICRNILIFTNRPTTYKATVVTLKLKKMVVDVRIYLNFILKMAQIDVYSAKAGCQMSIV